MICPICRNEIEKGDECLVDDDEGLTFYCFDCYAKCVNGELDDRINHVC